MKQYKSQQEKELRQYERKGMSLPPVNEKLKGTKEGTEVFTISSS